jgi:hypothetical protein
MAQAVCPSATSRQPRLKNAISPNALLKPGQRDLTKSASAKPGAVQAAIVEDRNRSHKHAQRARIILLWAERLTVLKVAACSGASRPSVRRTVVALTLVSRGRLFRGLGWPTWSG